MRPPPPGDPLIGRVIDDRYRILTVIGRGGMGVVYEAEATRLGKRRCAVKVLLPEYTRNETAVARFAREAQVAARVKHPNVVEIFDTGATRDGLGYIAMELLQGESLDRTLRRDGALPWPRAQRIIQQICRALAAAHAEGIVHRDMKPENCFRCARDDEDDFIKVLDFGIAKLTDPEANPESGRLTATNSVIGTYSYMAYEQICGEEVDHRVDVWASGVILYELLTGKLPFRGNNQGQLWRAITEYDPAPMRNVAPSAGIPEALEPIVRQALAKKLTDRYPTIEALARAVAGVQADGTIRTVTGKLPAVSRHEATAATIGVAATMAMDSPRGALRTDTVHSHGLTELGPEDVVDTNETAIFAAASPTTTPGPARDAVAMQTASPEHPMPARPVAPHVTPAHRGRRVALLLAGLGLPTAAILAILARGGDAPVTPTAPPAESSGPDASPTNDAAQAVTPTAAPQPIPEPVVEPSPPIVEPLPPVAESVVNSPTPVPIVISFADRAKRALRKVKASAGLKKCFSDAVPSMVVTVTIAARTGVATVTVPTLKLRSVVAGCVEDAFKNAGFPKGASGDADYIARDLKLSR